MLGFPAHHHMYGMIGFNCPICGCKDVTAYKIKGGAAIKMKAIRRKYRFLFKG